MVQVRLPNEPNRRTTNYLDPSVPADLDVMKALAESRFGDAEAREPSLTDLALARDEHPFELDMDDEAVRRRRKNVMRKVRINRKRAKHPARWPTDPEDMVLALRDYEACKLRMAAFTWRQIAEIMDLRTESGSLQPYRARKMVERGLKRWYAEDADLMRQTELARLEALTQEFWPIMMDDQVPVDRRMRVVDRYMMIADRKAKLAGIDAPPKPQQVDLNVNSTSTHVVKVAEEVSEYIGLLSEIVSEHGVSPDALGLPVGSPDAADDEVTDAEIVE